MDQQVKPLTALLLLLTASVLLGLVFWTRGESLRVGGPDQMQTTPDGGFYLHIAGTLYRLNPAFDLSAEYELANFGVQELVGDFAFFSNGDILVRRGRYDPTLLESIARFLRRPANTPPVATQADEGLFRCDLESRECLPFGEALDFDGAFHLSIDPATDTVFVSDTERHVLRKYDRNGDELAVSGKDFFFPNQNLLQDGGLLVADTNNHAVQFVAIGTEGFGRIQESHPIYHPSLEDDIWPYSLARVGNQWWVTNMAATMSDGTVTIYDEDWKYVDRLALPGDADPIDLAVLEDRVVITDLANIRLYQVDYSGADIGGKVPNAIEARLAKLRHSQRYYRMLSVGAIAFFVLLLAGGFIAAIKR